jgi:extradiol dioxygenase family protein
MAALACLGRVFARCGGSLLGIEPDIRFRGQVGEQATMFFQDPSGNALEFKAFRDRSQLFAR